MKCFLLDLYFLFVLKYRFDNNTVIQQIRFVLICISVYWFTLFGFYFSIYSKRCMSCLYCNLCNQCWSSLVEFSNSLFNSLIESLFFSFYSFTCPYLLQSVFLFAYLDNYITKIFLSDVFIQNKINVCLR